MKVSEYWVLKTVDFSLLQPVTIKLVDENNYFSL